jgi:hypothetical protein
VRLRQLVGSTPASAGHVYELEKISDIASAASRLLPHSSLPPAMYSDTTDPELAVEQILNMGSPSGESMFKGECRWDRSRRGVGRAWLEHNRSKTI